MPTPTPLVLPAKPPAALKTVSVSVAWTVMFWLAVTPAPSSMNACVSIRKTLTLDEPPMAAPPLLPAMPAAKLVTPTVPMSGRVSSLGVSVAFDVTLTEPPVAVTVAFAPTLAVVSSWLTILTATAMPRPVPPSRLTAAPPATFWIWLRLSALTVTLPLLAVSVALLPTVAWVSRSR